MIWGLSSSKGKHKFCVVQEITDFSLLNLVQSLLLPFMAESKRPIYFDESLLQSQLLFYKPVIVKKHLTTQTQGFHRFQSHLGVRHLHLLSWIQAF